MHPERIAVFLPCHSLDDFPTWLDDHEADDLLAAWTAAWHPELIAAVGAMPTWASVEVPPADGATLLGIVPSTCDDRFAALLDAACLAGSRWVRGMHGRQPIVAAACAALEGVAVGKAPPLADDFFALGLAWLLAELLARRMRSSTALAATDFGSAVVAAARAAVSGDETLAREKLRECFGALEATRSQYYPVDVWLLDLVLLADSTLGSRLAAELDSPTPLAVLTTGRLIETLARTDPPLLQALRERVGTGRIEIVGGRHDETPLDLHLLEAIRESIARGRAACQEHLGTVPVTFGQCTGGSSAFLPQVLAGFEYRGAIWSLFDGTPLPDPGASRIRWQAPDGATIDAVARPPLDARSAAMILSLAEKIGDAMDHDHTCVIQFAHHAGTASPWFHDLRRIGAWCKVVGGFVTPHTLFEQTSGAGTLVDFAPDAFSPTLPDARVEREADPVGSRVAAVEAEVCLLASSVRPLPELALPNDGPATGTESARQRTGLWQSLARGLFGGEDEESQRLTLDNGLVRLAVHPQTGGVLSLRRANATPNRLSQQLALRTTRAAPAVGAAWESPEERAEYSGMAADRIERESETAISSRGRLIGVDGRDLGTFRQRLALLGSQPLVRLEIEVELARGPGGPIFEEHVACRFAWNENDDLDVCRSMHGESAVTKRTRFTAPHFIELRSAGAGRLGGGGEEPRVLICTGGLPWHVRATPHTVDTILLAAGNRRGRWQVALGLGIEEPKGVALALIRESAGAAS